MCQKLRMLLATGLFLSGPFFRGAILPAQEAAQISGDPAVRFEQSPGFFHYAALCRTPIESTAHVPPPKLPRETTESAVCWYVKASRSSPGAGSIGASSMADGKLVVSAHHVRFMPHDPLFADMYADIDPRGAELSHEPKQPFASLKSKEVVYTFRFSKLCPSCAPGTPIAPGFNPALLDQEFGLLDESLKHFDFGWKQIYHLSSGAPLESPAATRSAALAASPGAHPGPESKSATAPKSGAGPVSSTGATHFSGTDSSLPSTTASKPAAAPTSGSGAGTKPKPAPSVNSNFVSAAAKSGPNTGSKTTPAAATRTPAPPLVEPRKTGPNKVKLLPTVADSLLVKKVAPVYPLEAKVFRLEGKVVLRTTIDKTGEVSEVNALTGVPLLESAAVEAVKQWQYRPYFVNGQAVDFETTVQVVFALDGSQPANPAPGHP